MKKISLHIIVKDEIEPVKKLVKNAQPYFDGIFLTVSDKKAYEQLKDTGVNVDYRAWNDRFDDARNHNWDLGKDYDASMWLDADDAFDFSKIPEIVSQLAEYGAVFLPYHYEHDENGNVIVSHWRERMVKRNLGFYWKGWVHENLITDEPFKKVNLDIPVIHQPVAGHREKSGERNHKILVKAYEQTEDPRYIHYLGISYFTLGEFETAIEILKQYCEVGGWDEEIYRSLLKMAEASHMLGNYDNSMQYALKAVALMPQYPMAYELLCHFELTAKNYKEALEWCKVALSKPFPKTASIFDPTSGDRAILNGALCEYELGNRREAVELLKRVKTIDVSPLLPDFEYEASIERLHDILPALFKHYDDPAVVYDKLKEEIKYRPEFRKYRERFTEPRVWPKKSIVFFCGRGYEEWGPHTLDKGMGGSEEAIVYLSKELAKLGYSVTVYGEVSEPKADMIQDAVAVRWLPWQMIDKRDKFDTLVIWRYPQFATQFTANKMFIDMHDLLPKEIVKPYKNAHYLFKTQWHKDQYPDIENFSVIGNGIVTDQFKTKKKKPFSVIYPSAYYRGLECLLDVWKDVKEQVPGATLDVYYGWQSWVSAEGEDEFYHRMCEKLEKAKKLDVTEHGRVDHQTLADKMAQTKVWAYPTEFPEIHCITAIKANMANCKPVITDVAALAETGGPVASFIESDTIYRNDFAKEEFTEELVKALKASLTKEEKQLQKDFAQKHDWSNIAKEWKETIR